MRKSLKQVKATKAEYFKSESQRKRTNRLAFITGSKQLIAIITVLVVASIGTGAYITQKQKDSKAFSSSAYPVSSSSNPNWANSWAYRDSGLINKESAQAAGKNLVISFPKGTYNVGQNACYKYNNSGIVAGDTLSSITVSISGNLQGSTSAYLVVNGAKITDPDGPDAIADRTKDYDFTVSDPAILATVPPSIEICHQANSASIGAERYIFVKGFVIRGQSPPPAPGVGPVPAQTTPPPAAPQAAAPARCVPVHKKQNATGVEAEAALPKNGQALGNNEPSASNCTFMKITAAQPLQHVFTGNSDINTKQNYALIVRGKGKVKATVVVEDRGGGKVREFDLTSKDNGFSTVNILSYFNNADQNISGDILKDLPAGKKVTLFLNGNPNASVDWIELRKSGNQSSIGGAPSTPQTNNNDKKTVRISGVVKSSDGTALPNVKISDCGKQTGQGNTPAAAKTGNNGQYYFDVAIGSEYCVALATTLNGRLIGNSGFGKPIKADNGSGETYQTKKAVATDEKNTYNFTVTRLPDPIITINPNATNCPATPEIAIDVEVVGGEFGDDEAQNGGVRSALGANQAAELVDNDNSATGCRAIKFKKPGAYIQTDTSVWSNREAGNYALIVRTKGKSTATISLSGFGSTPNKAITATIPLNSTGFSNTNVLTFFNGKDSISGNLVNLKSTDNLTIKISSNSSDPLIIDYIELRKAAKAPATPPPAGGGSGGTTRTGGGDTPARTQTACEATESTLASRGVLSGPKATVVPDSTRNNSLVAGLFANNDSVECKFKITPELAGAYTVGIQARSQDSSGQVAKARLSMTGKNTPVNINIDASKGQKYSNLFSRDGKDYRVLSAGDEVTLKATFINDGSNPETNQNRNLYVYSLMLVKSQTLASSTSSDGATRGTTSNPTFPCNPGKLDSTTAKTMNSLNTKVEGEGVRLLTGTSYLECTLYAPEKGNYILGASVKNDSIGGVLKTNVKLEFLTGSGKSDTAQAQNGAFKMVRMASNTNNKVELEANAPIKVRISTPNAAGLPNKRQAIIESVRLIQVDKPNDTVSEPADDDTDALVSEPGPASNPELVVNNTITGSKTIRVQAENSAVSKRNGAAVFSTESDPPQGKQAVRLIKNKSSIEYRFTVDKADFYRISFSGLSEDIKLDKGNAKAKFFINGNPAKGGNEINLTRGNNYKLYSTKEAQELKRGSNTIRIEFSGDTSNIAKGQDRNLIVDYMQITTSNRVVPLAIPVNERDVTTDAGTAIMLLPRDPTKQSILEVENAHNCQSNRKRVPCGSLGIRDPQAKGKRAIQLNRKGDFVEAKFLIQTTGHYTISPRVKSQDYQFESAVYDFFVNGKKVSSNISALPNKYEAIHYADRRFKAGDVVTLKLVYKNDKCGDTQNNEPCDKDHDRNLFVDQFQLEYFTLIDSPDGVVRVPSTGEQGGSSSGEGFVPTSDGDTGGPTD